MKSRQDSAVSETIGTILIILLVVVLAAIVLTLAMGITILPKKPVLAGFSVDVVKGADANPPHALTVPVIRFSEIAGDTLTQEYSPNTHSGINGTKIKLIDPNGKMYTVVQAISLTGKELNKGESFYIFHYLVGEPNEYWLTNDPTRVFASSGVIPFTPHGNWRLLITDEKDTNMVILDKTLAM
jgi:FlaG/FlaF family flagellin (archaellin)